MLYAYVILFINIAYHMPADPPPKKINTICRQ